MAASPNLKVKVGADTSGFDAGMKKGKAELKDFSKVSGSALDALNSALGVNIGKLGELGNAAKVLGQRFTDVGKVGSKSFQDMIPAIKSVGTALAGIGIAAAAIAFKSLNAEAETFKKTMEGAKQEAMLQAYVETYRQSLHNSSQAGKFWTDFMDNFKRDWASFTAGAGTVFSRLFSGQGLKGIGKDFKDARVNADQAATIAGRILDIQRQITQQESVASGYDRQIAELKTVIIDKSKTQAERQAALAEAQELIRKKYEGAGGLIALNERLAQLYATQNSITESSDEDVAREVAQRQKANSLAAQEQTELQGLIKKQNSLNTAVGVEVQSRKEAAAAAQAAWESRVEGMLFLSNDALSKTGSLSLPNSVSSAQAPGILPFTPVVNNWSGFFTDVDGAIFKQWPSGMKIGVTWDYEEGLIDFTQAVESTLSSLADTTGTLIGQLVGDLATGGDAWGNFANTALSALGDMAISVGKMAIATGTATLGIKAALESLNGWVAIAAGVALVALGSAVRTGLSNVANGNYGASMASAPVASSNYGNTNDYSTREMNINVTGTLTGDGDQLVAVINGTEKKNTLTT